MRRLLLLVTLAVVSLVMLVASALPTFANHGESHGGGEGGRGDGGGIEVNCPGSGPTDVGGSALRGGFDFGGGSGCGGSSGGSF